MSFAPLPLVVVPELLLPDVDAVLTYAVHAGVPLVATGPGTLAPPAFRQAPRELQRQVIELAPLLADLLRATRGTTPMLATVALWWDVRMFRASRATRVAIADASQHRLERGIAPLRARHLLALGDVAFPLAPTTPAPTSPSSPLAPTAHVVPR